MGVKEQLAAEESSDTTTGSRVWGPRVEQGPIINSTADSSERWASDWTNSTLNTDMSKADAVGLYGKLPVWQQSMFQAIADASTSGMDSGRSVYERYVDSSAAYWSQGQRRTPAELALADIQSGAVSADVSGDGRSKGRGGYSGPVTTNALMDEQSAEMLLNGLATDMLGRNLTKKELAKYTAQFRQQELANPTVTTSTPSSQTSIQGMADEDIARTILQDNPAFADNVLKTDVLDMFFNRIGGQNG